MDFIVEEEDIRFGLLSIKGISDKSMEKLNDFRDQYSDKFEIFQASKQAGLNIGVLSALIQAGALEGFKQSRSKVVYEAQLWNILTKREAKYVSKFAEEYNYDLVKIIKVKGNSNDPIISNQIIHLRPHVRTRTYWKDGKAFSGNKDYYEKTEVNNRKLK